MNYLLLDKNDITKVCGEMSAKELRAEMGNITNSSLCAFVKKGEPYKDKYIIIEKEFSPEKEVFLENINGIDYFVNSKCKVYHLNKNGKKVFHTPYKRENRFFIKYGGKEHNLSRVVARSFLKRNLSVDDVVIVKDGKLKLENIIIMNKKEACKIFSSKAKNKKKVGLFENGKLVKKFESVKKAGENVYLSEKAVSNICRGFVKKKCYDLRFI